MEKRVKVVHVPVGEEPRVIEVDNDLGAFQELVGGSIEHHGMGRGLSLVCNEEGMMLNLPQNGCAILGPYFFTKVDGDGDNVSLTDAECDAIRAHVAMYRLVRHSGNAGFEVKSFGSMEELLDDIEAGRRHAGEAN